MIKYLIAVILLLSPACLFAATPTISGVAGAVNTGQTLTVSGANLVNEITTGRISGFDGTFESGSGSWGDPEAGFLLEGTNHASCVRSFDTDRKLTGSKSAKFSLSGAIDSSGGGVGCAVYTSNGLQDYYISSYMQWDTTVGNSTWPNNFLKAFLSGATSPQAYSQPANGTGARSRWVAVGGSEVEGDIPGGAIQDGRWYHIETRVKNTSPRRMTVWIDGQQIIDFENSSSTSYAYSIIGVPNLATTFSGFAMDTRMDNFYISSNRNYPLSKIEIANSATYATATRVYQEPLYLSDGSVQIKANLNGLGAGPYYLFVTNNNQEVSSAYPLSGELPDTEPPVLSAGTPSGALSSGTTQVTMTVTTHEDATCKFASSAGTAYASMPTTFSSTGTTIHSHVITGLVDGSVYNRYIRCSDSESNVNTTDYTISWSVSMPSAPGSPIFTENFEDAIGDSYDGGNRWYDENYTDIVSGGFSGNALRLQWAQGETSPADKVSARYLLDPMSQVFMRVYMKFDAGWVGSQQDYHPHLIMLLSDQDGDYAGPANNYLNTYFEAISDVGPPYRIRPAFAYQDRLRVNSTYGLPSDLRLITENRSTAACNQPIPFTSSTTVTATQDCYDYGDGGNYYSSAGVKAATYEIPKGQWVQVDTWVKMNTVAGGFGLPDGEMKMWVDGIQILDSNNVIFRTNQHPTMKFKQLMIAPYIGDGSPITQTMYIDELSVYDTNQREGGFVNWGSVLIGTPQ